MPHPSKDFWVEEQEVLASTSSHYLVQSFLGEGSFGKVATCLNIDTKQTVAVKILKKTDDNMVGAEEEIAMLQLLKALDPDKCNIVRWFEHFVHRGHACLVFEMLDISLFDYMKARHLQPLSLLDISVITQQLAVAFQALKAKGIIHADLKGDNIMFVNRRDQPLKVKLIDFGLAIPVSDLALGDTFQALQYRAPEVVLGLPITEAIDIWSLGCVVASLFLGNHLYQCCDEYELMACIMDTHDVPSEHLLDNGIKSNWYFTRDQGSPHHGWRLKTPEEFYNDPDMEPDRPPHGPLDDFMDILPSFYPGEDEDVLVELIDLLKGMLTLDPGLRMTPRDILQHPFISLLPEYYGHSFVSDSDQDDSEESSSTTQRKLSPHNQSDNWSGCVSRNTSLGSLPVGLSTSRYHNQYSHHQESGQDHEGEQQWVEEGEENLHGINCRDEEVICLEEEGRGWEDNGVERQIDEGEWTAGGERGEGLLNKMFPLDTDPWVEEQEGMSGTSSHYLTEAFRVGGEWTAGGERGGCRRAEIVQKRGTLRGERTLKEAWERIQSKKRRRKRRKENSEMREKRRRKGRRTMKYRTTKMRRKRKKRRKKRKKKIIKRRRGRSKMKMSRNRRRRRRRRRKRKIKKRMTRSKKRMRKRRRKNNIIRGRRRRRMRRRRQRKRSRTRRGRRRRRKKKRRRKKRGRRGGGGGGGGGKQYS